MEQNTIDLTSIERQAYLAYHEDGLLDIFGGLIMLFFGVFMWTQMIHLAAVSWMVWLAYLPAKQKLTFPRIGYANYAPSQKAKQIMLGTVSFGVGLLFFIFTITRFFNLPPWEFYQHYQLLLIGLALGGISACGAYMLHINRYYWYALLIAVGFGSANFNPVNLPVTLLTMGIIIIISGSIILTRFINRYPVNSEARACYE
ncbi:MAG: hypothetical protein ABIA75_05730 [Candidatus Neomarinimicrobiota bacterium]